MQAVFHPTNTHAAMTGNGPKGPPSAPPTVPPIIITPFNRDIPSPSIDPRRAPPGPPILPPARPAMRMQ